MRRKQLWMEYVAVAAGGVVGAFLREGIELLLSARLTDHIPLATLFINWTGSLFLGWFYTRTIWHWRVQQWVRAGLGTGLVGAFTTFSTFSVESVQLLGQNAALGILYIVASAVGGIGLSQIGMRLAGEQPEQKREPSLKARTIED